MSRQLQAMRQLRWGAIGVTKHWQQKETHFMLIILHDTSLESWKETIENQMRKEVLLLMLISNEESLQPALQQGYKYNSKTHPALPCCARLRSHQMRINAGESTVALTKGVGSNNNGEITGLRPRFGRMSAGGEEPHCRSLKCDRRILC